MRASAESQIAALLIERGVKIGRGFLRDIERAGELYAPGEGWTLTQGWRDGHRVYTAESGFEMVGEDADEIAYNRHESISAAVALFGALAQRRGWMPRTGWLTVTAAAREAGVSIQAVRDVLRDDARRDLILPSTIISGEGARRRYLLLRAEVEAWQPRRK